MFAIIVGGSLAGLLGAILALPVTAAFRDVVRYLFRRLSPGRAGGAGRRRCRNDRHGTRTMADADRPVQDPPGRLRGRGRGHPGRLSTARAQVPPGSRRTPRPPARMSAINAAWELIGDPPPGGATTRTGRPAHADDAAARARPRRGRHRRPARRAGGDRGPAHRRRHRPAARDRVARLDVGPLDARAAATTNRCTSRRASAPPGPPPGRPSGSVLNFGRYAGWSLGEIARHDLEYIEWLDRAPIGRQLPRGGRRDPAARPVDAAAPPPRRADRRGPVPPALGRGHLAGRRRSPTVSGRPPSRWSCPGPAA